MIICTHFITRSGWFHCIWAGWGCCAWGRKQFVSLMFYRGWFICEFWCCTNTCCSYIKHVWNKPVMHDCGYILIPVPFRFQEKSKVWFRFQLLFQQKTHWFHKDKDVTRFIIPDSDSNSKIKFPDSDSGFDSSTLWFSGFRFQQKTDWFRNWFWFRNKNRASLEYTLNESRTGGSRPLKKSYKFWIYWDYQM